MIEIWKDIKGYEGLYQVSNLGRVKNLERQVNTGANSFRLIKERILKLGKNKDGYPVISIRKNGIKKGHIVNRLVAIAFIHNLDHKPCVNHLNGIKTDNNVNNLEWATYSENEMHSYHKLGKRYVLNGVAGRIGKANPMSKPVICINTNEYFESANIAAKKLGVDVWSICCVCKGTYKQIKGLKFKYAV